MPLATNLVIKNAANVDKTFTLMNPASGNDSPAAWALKEGAIASVFPQVTVMTRTTGNSSRQARFKFRVPSSYTDTVTGLTNVNSAMEANLTVSIPNNFPEAKKDDFVAFFSGLMVDNLMKAVFRDAYPAT